MDSITIRKATAADMEVLLRFEQGVISAERPFDPTLKPDPNRYYDLEEMLTASHIYLVVAEYDRRPIGSGYARIEPAKPYLRHTRHAYLGFMYVEPAYRGKGVNKKIIGALADWALSKEITELRLDVYHENVSAIRAYEKAGFIQHMVLMRRPVKASSPADTQPAADGANKTQGPTR
ncbi:MAG TPA: GNAT family N-acetyltransferase [Puia sp.]|nr:GNAT family N-acetyltransferase [Puia sp.]